MITVVVGKEIEKIKGDFESYLNGLNMVGEISYSQYSKLYDEGTKQIQKAYELGKSELELKIKKLTQHLEPQSMTTLFEQVEEEVEVEQRIKKLEDENKELKREKIPQLERKIASIRGAHSVDCKKLNARIEQVERLKKENAELKQLIEWLDMAIDSDIPIADKLAELEKENARLKEEIQNNEDLATVAYMQGAESQKKKYEKWLIKGKELLNEFMRISKASDEDFEHDYSELIEEVEQFLNSEVSE